MKGLETDHMISGPKRGLKINITGRGQTYTHTYRHRDSKTDPAQRAKSVKNKVKMSLKQRTLKNPHPHYTTNAGSIFFQYAWD